MDDDERDGVPPSAPLDPREARDRHRQRHEPSAGLQYLRSLTAEERRWRRAVVERTAWTYNLDPDDLEQDLDEGLLTYDAIDQGREGVRAWIRQRIEWKAGDTIRREQRRRSRETCDEETALREPAPEPVGPDASWGPARLEALGLSRDEAQVLLLVLWGIGLTLRDFAGMAGRSHAKARKDKGRGLAKIENLFHLTADERAAVVAYRHYPTTAAAAIRLNLAETELRRRLDSAQHKIDRALGHAPDDRGDEDDSDAR